MLLNCYDRYPTVGHLPDGRVLVTRGFFEYCLQGCQSPDIAYFYVKPIYTTVGPVGASTPTRSSTRLLIGHIVSCFVMYLLMWSAASTNMMFCVCL